jgi:hypothetical protein
LGNQPGCGHCCQKFPVAFKRGHCGEKAARAVATAAHRALGPRLIPPLIEAYERGEPVTAGDACIDEEGFTMRPGKRLIWAEIKSVTIRHAPKGSGDVAARIDIRVIRKNRLHYFDPTGIPNAIFFAHVLLAPRPAMACR